MEMGNTSTYNREYYLKNKERISENQKMRIKNMTSEEREVYLNRMRDWYRNRRGRFVSKSELREENKKLKEKLSEITMVADDEKQSIEHILELEEENKKLKEENEYRHKVVDIIPEWEWDVAEETIQDLQKRINELVWFEKEYHRLRDRIKELEWVLEHEYGRKVPY